MKKLNAESLRRFFDERPAITKTKFAKQANVSYSLLNFILRGQLPLTDETAAKLVPTLTIYGY